MDGKYFSWYQLLVDCGLIAYTVFEMTQVCHLIFAISRFFKARIDYDKGVIQPSALVILSLTITALVGTVYVSLMPISLESLGLWVSILVLLGYSYFAEKPDAIILNGAAVAFYLALLTSLDCSYLQRLEVMQSS